MPWIVLYFWPLACFDCREQALQNQLRQATESVKNMQKLHESAQSQLFELRTQSGLFPSFVTFILWLGHTIFLNILVNWRIPLLSEEDKTAKEAEVNLLLDEVERAQARLISLEREKVAFHFAIVALYFLTA
jgi:homeobox protein cut-like